MKKPQISFILVRPRYPGNIGSAARVMKNMGFKELILVRPSVLPLHPESRRLAVGAENLLKKAKVFDSLEEAVGRQNFLIGTSRRTGKYRKDFVLLEDVPSSLFANQKVGILFGPEERGLTNKELSLCHSVITIPSNPNFPSLNLAQSIAIVAYRLQIALAILPQSTQPSQIHSMASSEEMEGMYEHLEKMLIEIRFVLGDHRSFHMMRGIRQLINRARPTSREVKILRGICRQVLWAVNQKIKIKDVRIIGDINDPVFPPYDKWSL